MNTFGTYTEQSTRNTKTKLLLPLAASHTCYRQTKSDTTGTVPRCSQLLPRGWGTFTGSPSVGILVATIPPKNVHPKPKHLALTHLLLPSFCSSRAYRSKFVHSPQVAELWRIRLTGKSTRRSIESLHCRAQTTTKNFSTRYTPPKTGNTHSNITTRTAP